MSLARTIVFVAATFVAGCCPITWDGPFEGTIVDAKTGKPIEGAVIGAFWYRRGTAIVHDWTAPYAGQDAVTDGEGKFRIDGLHAINWLPFSCIEEPSFTIYASGYHGCRTAAADAIGGCGQPDVRLTPADEPKPDWAQGKVNVDGDFMRFVPRMVEAIRNARARIGANPNDRKGDSPQWSPSP